MRKLLILLPLAIAAAPPDSPAGTDADRAQGQTHDLALARDDHDRMTVAVRVSDSGPYRFLVDTGAERTVISRELADHLGLIAGARTRLHSVVGSSDVATVNIPTLQVSAIHLAIRNAPALGSMHIGADGLLGVDSLVSQRVLFDFKHGVMGISPSHRAIEPPDGDTIIVEAHRRHGRLLFTDADVDSHGAVVVVDTGSQISIGNTALRRKLLRSEQRGETVEIETVAGEKVVAEVATIRRLQLGVITLKDMKIAFTDAPVFEQLDLASRPALLLGMNALRAFDRVSIDFATKKVRFVLPGTSMTRQTQLASAR